MTKSLNMDGSQSTSGSKSIDFLYFDGINLSVEDSIAKKSEFSYGENFRSLKLGSVEKRAGYIRLANSISATANYGMFYFNNTSSTNNGFYRVSTVAATTSIYYLKSDNTWVSLTGNGTSLHASNIFTTEAESNLFIVNGVDKNRYISKDGSTVTTSDTAAGHLYNSPIANKISYYKDKLYVGSFYIGTTYYPTSIMWSSKPLGLITLVDGDHDTGVTEVNVTDTKYVHTSDVIQVYRAGTLITTLTVSAKTETSITVTATSVSLLSSDELWVNNSYDGTRFFRWSSNPQSGSENAKQYDTLKLSGSGSSPLTILDTINNVLVIANKETLATWNESQLVSFDAGVSCVSERGYVKAFGQMFFVGYNGLYSFDGSSAPKLLSAKVKPFFTGANKASLEGAAIGVKGNSILVSLAETTLYNSDGSIFKELDNVVLELNLEQNNWYSHCFSLDVNSSSSSSASSSVSPSSSLSHSSSSSLSPSRSISSSPSASLSPSRSISSSPSSSLSISSSVSSSPSTSPSGSIPSSAGIIDFETYIAEDNADRLMFNSENGEIYEIFKGNADDTGGNNFEIPWRVDLSPITLCSQWENQAFPSKIFTELKSGNGAQIFLDLNTANSFFPIQGNVSKGVTTVSIVPRSVGESEVQCRILTISLREISTRALKLSKLKLRYNETGQQIVPNS